MAKVSFKNLGLKLNQEAQTIEFNGQNIEVRQYLPLEDKLNLITEVVNNSADEQNFANPMKVQLWTALEIVFYYTNLNITDKQKEEPLKLYDMLLSSGLYEEIRRTIPIGEYLDINQSIQESVKSVYTYRNSVLGILDAVKQDYSNMEFDAAKIQKDLADPNNLALLKDVLTKLG